jgi:hypothetical protein
VGGLKIPPFLLESFNMNLEVFVKHQQESNNPFLCIYPDHEMQLVPFMTEELVIELRCFSSDCTYKIIPGLMTYKEILDKQSHD